MKIIIILTALISVFLITKRILKENIKNSKRLKITSFVVTIIVTPILYFGIIFAFFGYLFYQPQYNFEQEKWFADKKTRFKMRDDILESEMLKEKSPTEIIKIIGKPESKDSVHLWTYNLGMSNTGFGWQFNYLELTFINGKISNVRKSNIID